MSLTVSETAPAAAPVPAAAPESAPLRVCVCGLCTERVLRRSKDLQVQAERLAAASFRASDNCDERRALAYAQQARAARQEADNCARIARETTTGALGRVVTVVGGILRLVVKMDCAILPKRWPERVEM